ncbi:MAG TPA: cyclopropane-fatty-acyl-phospholipid synthase family protein [Sphingomicrobium sp.]|nr:cyclopropane-fatty-acyl-phospholipid synthase family protein [Sphingomicrobium sp.]
MDLIGLFLGKLLTRGRLHLIFADGTRRSFGPGGAEEVTVRLHDKRVALDIARDPKLAFAEAYIDGRLTIEQGDISQLLAVALGNNRWEEGGGGRNALGGRRPGLKSLLMPLVKSVLRRNPPAKARQNVAHHYDLSDQLYELFLDRDRQYSCAYFTDPANSLEQAQDDKKAHIAAKLYLRPRQRVLDIGCGWGGTALYLNRVADVDVLGVTLSEEQLKVARRRAEEAGVADRVRFELVDYRSLTGSFDRIVSIGMFEHVGAAHYDEFFATCRDLLAPDGVMLLHTIGRLGAAALNPDPFIAKYIFPGYHLPSLSQMFEASQKVRLIASDVETLRLHYAYTLRHWLERTRAAKSEIVALYDERFYRLWEFYLAGAIMLFETGTGCNYQVQFIRDRHALPITRDYMAEAEERYRSAAALPGLSAVG